jgi:(S)-ureidoglycine aminohydrolase
MTGFAETFSQYIVEVFPGGGSEQPGTRGRRRGRAVRRRGPGRGDHRRQVAPAEDRRLCLPAARLPWTLPTRRTARPVSTGSASATSRRGHRHAPAGFVANEQDEPIIWMPDTANRWGTTRFVDPADLRHDMHVNIVTLEPGAVIPFEETHVMEHGLYVLEGKAVYRLNRDWVEVEAGDFMWLRAFCPQACYAGPSASAICSTRTSTAMQLGLSHADEAALLGITIRGPAQ